MNKVISREYVEQNYIHKDVIREMLKDIYMVSELPVKNTTKKQVYKVFQKIYDLVGGNEVLWRIRKWG